MAALALEELVDRHRGSGSHGRQRHNECGTDVSPSFIPPHCARTVDRRGSFAEPKIRGAHPKRTQRYLRAKARGSLALVSACVSPPRGTMLLSKAFGRSLPLLDGIRRAWQSSDRARSRGMGTDANFPLWPWKPATTSLASRSHPARRRMIGLQQSSKSVAVRVLSCAGHGSPWCLAPAGRASNARSGALRDPSSCRYHRSLPLAALASERFP